MRKIDRKTFFRNSGAGILGLGALGAGCAPETKPVEPAKPAPQTQPQVAPKLSKPYGDFKPYRGGWIAYSDWHVDCRPMLDYPVAFRKELELEAAPRSAQVFVAVADVFLLYCNGRFVASGPARSWPREKYYDELDLAPYLTAGANHLALLLFPCTGVNFLNTFTRMGLFVQGDIVLDDDVVIPLDTDTSWLCRYADWLRFHGSLITIATGFQEHLDAAAEEAGWMTGKLSDKWQPALYLGSAGLPPWNRLVKRPVPALTENDSNSILVWRGRGSRGTSKEDTGLAAAFNADKLTGKAVNVSAGDWLEGRPGEVFAFDMGKTRYVRPGLEVEGVTGPLRLELYYDIQFRDRPSAYDGFGGGFNDTLRIARGGRTWQVHRGRGMRYITVKLTGSGRCRFKPLFKTLDYPFQEDVRLSVGDEFIQKIWDVSKENIRSSTNDAYVDTCSRENLLWAMDATATAKAAWYSFGESAMWRNCLKLLAMGIDADGNPGAVAPTECPSPLMDQSMHWVVSCYEYYLATGDDSLLTDIDRPLLRFMEKCRAGITPESLYIPPGYSWHWVDWAPLDKRPYALPMNALLLWCSQYAGKIAAVTGGGRLALLAREIGSALTGAIPGFFDSGVGAFLSRKEPQLELHLPPPKPNSVNPKGPLPEANIHGNVLSVVTGCGTDNQRRLALIHVADQLAGPAGPENEIGMGYTALLLTPMLAAGYYNQVRNKLTQLYGPFIERGEPTWGERASEEHENTAHGWGAAANTLIVEGLLGIRPTAPGWTSWSLSPAEGFEADFEYSLPVPGGVLEVVRKDRRISASWPAGGTLEYKGQQVIGSGGMVELG